jgi:phosphoribosyl-AMP cyclohydrolase / phosphoribosyl-ATP pyrophosphohydrolase
MDLNFAKLNGLIPAIIQDDSSDKVLMVGFMNKAAFKKTVDSGLVTFYSRTRNRLWTKGEESGNFLHVKEIIPDCDQDSLLIKAHPDGPVCHTGGDTCFNEPNSWNVSFLSALQDLIHQRKTDLPEDSYTTKLFKGGINKIAQKVGEEAVELIIEAKDENDELLLNEAADLIYHLLVLLSARNKDIRDVVAVLEERHRK